MPRNLNLKKITTGIKLFTYITATLIILAENSPDKLTYLIPLIVLLAFVSNFKGGYLIAKDKHTKYIWPSIMLEIILIIIIGFIDKTGTGLLYFFICLSETIIVYPFKHSLFLIIPYIASRFVSDGAANPQMNTFELMSDVLFSYGVSIVFVAGMSYLVKVQVREKEKQIRINTELENAYKKLLEKASIEQQLSIEKERTRMAREIHDTLAHTLTTLIVQLEACKKLASVDTSRLPVELEKAQEITRSGLSDVKRTIKALRPQALEGKAFFDSVLGLVNDIMQNTSVQIVVNNNLPKELKLQSSLEIALFRIIQESITNSLRHGSATRIEIEMSLDISVIKINISDNGIGCAHIKKGYGLQGIGERIEGLDGNVEFYSTKENGFRTIIWIPCKEA